MKGSLFLKLPFSFVETGAHPKKHRLPGTALFVPASGTPEGIGSARGSRRLSRRRSPARPWLRPLPFRSCFLVLFSISDAVSINASIIAELCASNCFCRHGNTAAPERVRAAERDISIISIYGFFRVKSTGFSKRFADYYGICNNVGISGKKAGGSGLYHASDGSRIPLKGTKNRAEHAMLRHGCFLILPIAARARAQRLVFCV